MPGAYESLSRHSCVSYVSGCGQLCPGMVIYSLWESHGFPGEEQKQWAFPELLPAAPYHSLAACLSKQIIGTDSPHFGHVLEGTSEDLPLDCHVPTCIKALMTANTVSLVAGLDGCSPGQGSPFFLWVPQGAFCQKAFCKCEYSPPNDGGQDLFSLVSNLQFDMWQSGFPISMKTACRSKSLPKMPFLPATKIQAPLNHQV